MEWHWCFWGEWHGPYTLQRINELTATLPNQFLMASGGTDEELDELRTFPRLGPHSPGRQKNAGEAHTF